MTADRSVHQPVMVPEVLEYLAPTRGGVFVDCTVGLGGHARALLDAGASRILGLDRDPAVVERAVEALREYGDRVAIEHRDYRELDDMLDARGVTMVAGVLADLGVSSIQLDAPGRGFSFRRDEPLDMRMDPTSGPTAAEAIAGADERTLADVIYRFGEERRSRRIARAIVWARERQPIATTSQLADVVRRATPRKGASRIDPATRTFQAIRIWVNRELDGLDAFLERAVRRLDPGGRLTAVTFHSLEDRIVKHTFRALQAAGEPRVTVLTKRPVTPSAAEVRTTREREVQSSARWKGLDDRRQLRVRHQEGHQEQSHRPRGRLRPAPRHVAHVGIGVFLVSVVLFSAWQHFEQLRYGYRLEQVQRERAAEAELNGHLRLEVETLSAPARIERLATERLGMVEPGPADAAIIERVVAAPPPSIVTQR